MEEDDADDEYVDLDPDHIAERENHSEIESPEEESDSSSSEWESRRIPRPSPKTLEERLTKEHEDLEIKSISEWKPRQRGGINKRKPLRRQAQDQEIVSIERRKEDPDFEDYPYPGLGFRPGERESHVNQFPLQHYLQRELGMSNSSRCQRRRNMIRQCN
jgi:hypothetical protein